jgi:hypothetical protein
MGCNKIMVDGIEKTITTRKDKYQIIKLDGKIIYLHRYLAQLHIPNPNNYPMINHIDGNKSNNSIDNLEWTTALGNRQHAIENKLWGKNILDKRKLTDEEADEIRNKYIPKVYTMKKISKEYNVDYKTIWDIINNKTYNKKKEDYYGRL